MRVFYFLILSGLCASPGIIYAGDQTTSSSTIQTPLASSQAAMTRQEIQDRVRVYREQRYERMPYLDRRIIKEIITPRQVQEKTGFISSKNAKSLQEIITRAVRSHTPAKAAWERMSLAKRKILVALRNLFPTANFELGNKEGSLTALGFHSKNYRFKFRQPVFHGGLLWNTLLQGKAELEASENQYDATLGELIRDISKAYFEYTRASNLIHDNQVMIENTKIYKEMSLRKYKEGIVSEIENLNAQSLFGQLEFELETSRQELELAKLELQKFLNLQGNDEIDVKPVYDIKALFEIQDTGTVAVPVTVGQNRDATVWDQKMFNFAHEIPSLKVNDLVEMAYANRPELRVEAAKLESARLGQKIKWAKFMPQADVTLEFGRLGETFNEITMNPDLHREFRLMLEFNWNVAGNKIEYTLDNDERAPSVTQFNQGSGSSSTANKLTMGLWDGLNDFVETKDADVKKIEQVIELEKAEKQVMQDVKQAYFDYQKNTIQVKSVLQKASYRKRLAELSKHRLEQNEIQISEYIQAELDYVEELTKLHKSLADLLKARADLNFAVGDPNFLKFGEGDGFIKKR